MKTLDGIKKLNAVKKADGELLIEAIDLKKLKGAKEKDLAEVFLTAIEGISEKDEQFIPEELAELYNKLAEETAPEPETKETAKPAAKAAKKSEVKETAKPAAKTAKKSEAAKKEAPKADSKKPAVKAEVKKGVITSILTIIKDRQPISMEDILKTLIKIFPERDATAMGKTIRAQIGGRGETRLGKEKGVKIKKTDSGEFIIAKK